MTLREPECVLDELQRERAAPVAVRWVGDDVAFAVVVLEETATADDITAGSVKPAPLCSLEHTLELATCRVNYIVKRDAIKQNVEHLGGCWIVVVLTPFVVCAASCHAADNKSAAIKAQADFLTGRLRNMSGRRSLLSTPVCSSTSSTRLIGMISH